MSDEPDDAGPDGGGSGDGQSESHGTASDSTGGERSGVTRTGAGPAPEAGHSATPPPGAVGAGAGPGPGSRDGDGGPSGLRAVLHTSLVTGAAITVPVLITVVVVVIVAGFVSNAIGPFASLLGLLPVGDRDPRLLEAATVVLIVVGMTVVGYVAAFRTDREKLEAPVDRVMSSLPGVGSVYETFNQMSEFLVDSDTESFQEVVLVEYPTEGSYALAFRTAEPPEAVKEATGHEDMVTLFMPMGPNPVAGGFVIHAASDRVHQVDLGVEDGIQSIVTSGVATGTHSEAPAGTVEDAERVP